MAADRRAELTDRWWAVVGRIANTTPQTAAGTRVKIAALRRIIEDSYLTDDCPADAIVRRLLDRLLPEDPDHTPQA
jgi:hypothetical protein